MKYKQIFSVLDIILIIITIASCKDNSSNILVNNISFKDYNKYSIQMNNTSCYYHYRVDSANNVSLTNSYCISFAQSDTKLLSSNGNEYLIAFQDLHGTTDTLFYKINADKQLIDSLYFSRYIDDSHYLVESYDKYHLIFSKSIPCEISDSSIIINLKGKSMNNYFINYNYKSYSYVYDPHNSNSTTTEYFIDYLLNFTDSSSIKVTLYK